MQGLDENPVKAVPFPSFVPGSATACGVAMDSLQSGDRLTVQTRNTRYEFTVVDPANRLVLVRGGSTFPEQTQVVVKGSTAGSSAIRFGWIGVGLFLELGDGARRITTSRVQSVLVHSLEPESLPLTA